MEWPKNALNLEKAYHRSSVSPMARRMSSTSDEFTSNSRGGRLMLMKKRNLILAGKNVKTSLMEGKLPLVTKPQSKN
uniref:Uncharacterized protein n=1 Tax=Rhizophagus irregularis (strain DAOM 181602 / DAOM 197198 / MUCL 43194) TaxID=747089 RepID=U9UDL4_RHIID